MEEELLAIAKRPPISIRPDATARDAAALMTEHSVGAAIVLDERGGLVGILSERDIVTRVVAQKLDPDATRVSDVMTKDVRTAKETDSRETAMQTMASGHFRHLPIVDASGIVLGMLSVRHLLSDQVGALSRRNADLVNFISADGAGG
jgi:CBS domain-containing protein